MISEAFVSFKENIMERSDRRLRNVLVVLGIAIAGWSVVSVGCLVDTLCQPSAEELKRVIEDPDWDSIR